MRVRMKKAMTTHEEVAVRIAEAIVQRIHLTAYGACHRSRSRCLAGGRHCEINGYSANELACWCLAGENEPKGHRLHQRRNARESKHSVGIWHIIGPSFGNGPASMELLTSLQSTAVSRGASKILYHDSGLQMRMTGRACPCDYLTHGSTCAGWYPPGQGLLLTSLRLQLPGRANAFARST